MYECACERMLLLLLLLRPVAAGPGTGRRDIFQDQARILSEDGCLVLEAGQDRNLSLRAPGTGRVLLNGQDLTSLAQVNNFMWLCRGFKS
jgi:hypothetical protein